VDIVPQKGSLRLSLNMPFSMIEDPDNKCKDITGLGRWGNGDVELKVESFNDIEYAMFLIKQSFKSVMEKR
jgi:predicted transport protein